MIEFKDANDYEDFMTEAHLNPEILDAFARIPMAIKFCFLKCW